LPALFGLTESQTNVFCFLLAGRFLAPELDCDRSSSSTPDLSPLKLPGLSQAQASHCQASHSQAQARRSKLEREAATNRLDVRLKKNVKKHVPSSFFSLRLRSSASHLSACTQRYTAQSAQTENRLLARRLDTHSLPFRGRKLAAMLVCNVEK